MKRLLLVLLLSVSIGSQASVLHLVDMNGHSLPEAVIIWQSSETNAGLQRTGGGLISKASQHLSPLSLDASAKGFLPVILAVRIEQELLVASVDGRRHHLVSADGNMKSSVGEVGESEDGGTDDSGDVTSLDDGNGKNRDKKTDKEQLSIQLRPREEAQRLQFSSPGMRVLQCQLHEHDKLTIYVYDGIYALKSDELGRVDLGAAMAKLGPLKVWHRLMGHQTEPTNLDFTVDAKGKISAIVPVTLPEEDVRILNRFTLNQKNK